MARTRRCAETVVVFVLLAGACLWVPGSEKAPAAEPAGEATRLLAAEGDQPLAADLAWPPITSQARPWTYWWWMGSAVDRANLTRNLEAYQRAGLGGVLIVPIYGVQGCEDRFLDYLSPQWMQMLIHTTGEARRLGLGVDMTTGTGWPFGGPQITRREAAARMRMETHPVKGGSAWDGKLDTSTLQALVAYRAEKVDGPKDASHKLAPSPVSASSFSLLDKVRADGTLDWTAPPGAWELLALFSDRTGQQVKRAAPGAKGLVVNPFSPAALDHYLKRFDRAFKQAGLARGAVRAQYHDSFEYFKADWSDDFFPQFRARRGYDLRTQLPALFGRGDAETVARVKSDYRQTLSDLHLQYISDWSGWAHGWGCLTRNQAHGAPGNLLDLYAAADIPETEIFGRGGGDRLSPLFSKLASSAAHVTGKPRASSETCTWLGEHFQVALADCKRPIDRLLVAGINHVSYHGIAYSPAEAKWPGWLFYASVNFGPTNSFRRDFPALNAYVARCQAVLQTGQPANDVLLYFPIHDLWHDAQGTAQGLTVHSPWLHKTACGHLALKLWERGYGFDYISDRQLAAVQANPQRLQVGGAAYRVVVVPRCRHLPVKTLETLLDLARSGATVVFHQGLPADVPGWGDLAARRERFHGLLALVKTLPSPQQNVRRATLGGGRILIGDDLEPMLALAGVPREPCVDHGLEFIRRTCPQGYHYFLINPGEKSLDAWVPLAVDARSAAILDPMTGAAGVAAVRRSSGGSSEVYLQLAPGQSCILRVFSQRQAEGPAWKYLQPAGTARRIAGAWQVAFLEGGPVLPRPRTVKQLTSWTEWGDAEAGRFAGTARYAIAFAATPGEADEWVLDLGRVAASARVRVNGRPVAVLFASPFQAKIGKFLKEGENKLEVEVTNLAANRIADMDRRRVPWRIFHEINFVNIKYKKFDASGWPPFDSGLLGPVRLVPMKVTHPK